MSKYDYEYDFSYIAGNINKGKLLYTEYRGDTSVQRTLKVAAYDWRLLERTEAEYIPSLLADLIDIAVAVHVADRLSQRNRDKTCRIHILLPMRNATLLGNEALYQELQDILYWFTEDQWSFEFTPYSRDGRESDMTRKLLLLQGEQSRRVALWSGGLDALGGLYHQLRQEQHVSYTLFGTGSNDLMFGVQKNVYESIKVLFPERVKLIQLRIGLRKQDIQTDNSARSRGFVFLLLGAVCTLLEKQHTLYIHENGIGALNLPLRDSEVGLDHSHSVHPLSLYRINEWLTKLIEVPFSFENPFLFSTKAQVCEKLLQERDELAFLTVSCDSRHHSDPPQCGYCSSCLLRRQALAVLEIEDRTAYQITTCSELRKKIFNKRYRSHLVATLAHISTLQDLLAEEKPWLSVERQYPLLEEVVQKLGGREAGDTTSISKHFLTLFENYVSEWSNDAVRNTLKQGLLK